jgi:hypothetical protein
VGTGRAGWRETLRPEISAELFEEGVARLTGNPELLVDRGWLILESKHPRLTLTIHHRATGKLRTFLFEFDNWNDQPPALSIVDPDTRQPVTGTLWPQQYQSYWHQSGWSNTPLITTPKPFMCMPGILEYHTHYSHVGDKWDNYKASPDYSIFGIVSQVAQVFQKSNV